MNLKFSVIAAILIGVANYIFVTYCWGYFAAHSPILAWTAGLEISNAARYSIIYLFDGIINILLCLPAAYLLCKLQPKRTWLYLSLAVIPCFLYVNRLLISDPSLVYDTVSWYFYLPGFIVGLFSIPVAVLVVHYMGKAFRASVTESI